MHEECKKLLKLIKQVRDIFKDVVRGYLWEKVKPDVACIGYDDDTQNNLDENYKNIISHLRKFISRVLKETEINLVEVKKVFDEIWKDGFDSRENIRKKFDEILEGLEEVKGEKTSIKTIESIVNEMNQENS